MSFLPAKEELGEVCAISSANIVRQWNRTSCYLAAVLIRSTELTEVWKAFESYGIRVLGLLTK